MAKNSGSCMGCGCLTLLVGTWWMVASIGGCLSSLSPSSTPAPPAVQNPPLYRPGPPAARSDQDVARALEIDRERRRKAERQRLHHERALQQQEDAAARRAVERAAKEELEPPPPPVEDAPTVQATIPAAPPNPAEPEVLTGPSVPNYNPPVGGFTPTRAFAPLPPTYASPSLPSYGEGYYGQEDGREKTVHVRGYYRKDGTYVSGHDRRPPRRHTQ